MEIKFTINGKAATGLQCEAHFMNWVLALEQEHHEGLLELCYPDGRTNYTSSAIFQVAAYQDYRNIHEQCLDLVNESGIVIERQY